VTTFFSFAPCTIRFFGFPHFRPYKTRPLLYISSSKRGFFCPTKTVFVRKTNRHVPARDTRFRRAFPKITPLVVRPMTIPQITTYTRARAPLEHAQVVQTNLLYAHLDGTIRLSDTTNGFFFFRHFHRRTGGGGEAAAEIYLFPERIRRSRCLSSTYPIVDKNERHMCTRGEWLNYIRGKTRVFRTTTVRNINFYGIRTLSIACSHFDARQITGRFLFLLDLTTRPRAQIEFLSYPYTKIS